MYSTYEYVEEPQAVGVAHGDVLAVQPRHQPGAAAGPASDNLAPDLRPLHCRVVAAGRRAPESAAAPPSSRTRRRGRFRVATPLRPIVPILAILGEIEGWPGFLCPSSTIQATCAVQ